MTATMGMRGAYGRIDLTGGRVLVLSQAGSVSTSSSVPFRDAVFIELDTSELPAIEGDFDAVAIDHTLIADDLLKRVVDVLQPAGAVIVVFPANYIEICGSIDPTALSGLDGKGLRWVAIEANRRAFCVVLRRTQTAAAGTASTSSQVSMVCEAFRLGAGHWYDVATDAQARLEAMDSEIDTLVERRHRSEDALLDHVEALVHALNLERRAHRDLKAGYAAIERRLIARRVARVARRAARLAMRAARRLRHGQLPGRNRS